MRQTRWRPFERVFTDGTSERRYRCELVFGQRTRTRYFAITTDPVHVPPETTWTIMTNLPGNIERMVGNTFGLLPGLNTVSSTPRMNWAGRITGSPMPPVSSAGWKSVMCAYLLVSLQAPALALTPPDEPTPASAAARQHPAWTEDASWKHQLTNVRLLLQPFVCACLLLPWLWLHPLPQLSAGLADLCVLMNTYHPLFPT